MRKFFSVAMESQSTNVNMISLEEEEVIMDEAVQDGTEVSQDLQEAERIIEVSDALEDLAVIADGIEEASPTEVALIENAGQMAVAGTDVEVDEIIPAVVADEMPAEDAVGEDGQPVQTPTMESYVGRKISTEGIREVARTIWENIKKFVKAIWEKITRFFQKIIVGLPRLQQTLRSLQEEINDLATKKVKAKDEEIVLTSGINKLSVNGAAFKDFAELNAGVKSLTEVSKWLFDSYGKTLGATGEKIAKAITGFDPKEPEKCAVALSAIFEGDFTPGFPKKEEDLKMFPDFKTKLSDHLLGNVRLGCKKYNGKVDAESGSAVAALERVRKNGLIVVEDKAQATECKFKPLALSDMRTLVESLIKLVAAVNWHHGISGYESLQKAKTSIEAAGSKAATTLAAYKDEGNESKVSSYYKSALNFNTAFANWSYNPFGPMVMHDITVAKAVVLVIKKSLAAYSPEQAEEKK